MKSNELDHYISMHSLIGITKRQYMDGIASYSCQNGADPVIPTYVEIFWQDATNSVLSSNVVMTVEIDYYCELFELVTEVFAPQPV